MLTPDEEMDFLCTIFEPCRVYWGSHGCCLPREHDGPHVCECAIADAEDYDPKTKMYYEEPQLKNVGAPPYYGDDTHFYGEDL